MYVCKNRLTYFCIPIPVVVNMSSFLSKDALLQEGSSCTRSYLFLLPRRSQCFRVAVVSEITERMLNDSFGKKRKSRNIGFVPSPSSTIEITVLVNVRASLCWARASPSDSMPTQSESTGNNS
jgi:hypothetical protein